MILHINRGPGPVEEVSREPMPERWCFRCRARVAFLTVIYRYDVAPSDDYYGPWAVIRCEHGHDDGDLFPGRVRVWDE